MKFVKAFDITAPEVYEAIRSGRRKVQRGQWVYCGPDRTGKPSRFVSARPGYLNIVHTTGPFCRGRFPVEVFEKRCALDQCT